MSESIHIRVGPYLSRSISESWLSSMKRCRYNLGRTAEIVAVRTHLSDLTRQRVGSP